MHKWYRHIVVLFVILVHLVGSAVIVQAADLRDAIVKVYAVRNTPDYYNPWNMQGPRSATGSGAVIHGNRILTNAHVVSDLTFLQVRKYGDTQRYRAYVQAISNQSDLALLVVEDPAFFDGITPLPFGGLPQTHEEVTVYGFPMGGDTLSITKGVVSRIEHQPYVHSSFMLLAAQIDAAINPGNSGGPVIVDGKIVGVIMQGIPSAQNLGYMVPEPIIRHFLDGVERTEYQGFPSLGFLWQTMENPDLRSNRQMTPDQTGVLVTRVLPGSPADGILQHADVIVALDDYLVANDGTIEFRNRERTNLSYVVQQYQVGDTINVSLLRKGVPLSVPVKLHRPAEENFLVPLDQYEVMPSYYIYGGLVFVPLTKNLLRIWGADWLRLAPNELVMFHNDNVPEVEGEQIVLILRVLADDVNTGYENMVPWIVQSVNGERIRNMEQLVHHIEADHSSPYTVFENSKGSKIVLDRNKVENSHEQLLSTYRIPTDRSEDLTW